MKNAVAILALFSVALVQNGATYAQGSTSSSLSATRLLGAMKLWGDIRFFDPAVSENQVDWDAAFMNAEPAIAGAGTPAAYAAAIDAMLSPLHDPITRVGQYDEDSVARITAAQSGTTSVITIEHGTSETAAASRTDAAHAVDVASKSANVLFDLRGVTEANASDSAALGFFAAPDSPILKILPADAALPRARSRSYLGYPNESSSGYQGYAASDLTSDASPLGGKSKQTIRFGFLVDASTSLPPLAIALASAGKAAIYSTGGQPAVQSSGSASMQLPDGVVANYRNADLADISERQPFASATVSGVPAAVAKLQSQSLVPATYASAPPERFVNNGYAEELFPPEPMRMLAIARVYNVIRYFSPYRALMHDDWDAAALQAIRDERAATDARSYVLALMEFYAHLHDSHGFISGKTVQIEFGAGPPFFARYLHRQVVVSQVYGSLSALQGIRVGDVIESVDGVPIRRAMERSEAYIASSTPQSADASALWPITHASVFSGRRGTTLTLRCRHPDRRATFTATLVRVPFSSEPESKAPKYLVLPGNVGYVDFDRLEPAEVDAMFAALKNTRAIVFDNRGYPEGAAWKIAPLLTTRTNVRLALFNTPLVIDPLDGEQGEIVPVPTYRQFYQMLDAASGPRYLKPTVMLIDERAISQSEHSALFFREAGHTRFVGTPTEGANGDVTMMLAPGGVRLMFSGEGVRWPDGKQLQRVGIVPDVRVEPTALDLARRNDVVLQRGLDEALRLAHATKAERVAAARQEIGRERSMSPLLRDSDRP